MALGTKRSRENGLLLSTLNCSSFGGGRLQICLEPFVPADAGIPVKPHEI